MNNGGVARVFIPISRVDEKNAGSLSPGAEVFDVRGPAKGISLTPPGYGLFQLATRMGAAFTQEGLEGEIKDVMENGLELASTVDVRQDGDVITISMAGMANKGMCRSIRSEDPDVCSPHRVPGLQLPGVHGRRGHGQKGPHREG